ncbi:hypothetical protein N7535_001953 [Penicillium sp. DV-2018c]|nr:hypothetical protein N7535_001953 [Penicillium sp. DV-2018c]
MSNTHPPNPPQALRIVITKFSHSTAGIDHAGPLHWTHIQGNGDLTCSFDKFVDSDSIPSRLIQKVSRGEEILEQLDLVYFVRMAALQAQLVPPPKPQFAVVVKAPCLAVKYPHGMNMVRRFQIKFTSERDYFTVLTLLREINCQFTESKSPVPAVRRVPSLSSWTSGHQSSVPPKTANTVATSTGSNWGAISPDQPTPIRAMSPASIVSHPALKRKFGQPPPAFILPSAKSAKKVLPEAPTHISEANQGPEPASSQLSARSANHELDQLNRMLPPKRDLPFNNPAAKRTRTASLSLMTPGKKQKKHSAPFSKSQPASQTKDSFFGPAAEPDDTHAFPARNSQDLSQPNFFQSEAHLEAERQLPLYEESRGARPRSSFAEHASQAASIQETLQARNDTVTSDPNLANWANDETSSTSKDLLAQYLASPTPERTAFLENWMCELIDDDNFMTLCEDVDKVWWRFAFGQKD